MLVSKNGLILPQTFAFVIWERQFQAWPFFIDQLLNCLILIVKPGVGFVCEAQVDPKRFPSRINQIRSHMYVRVALFLGVPHSRKQTLNQVRFRQR